jgi:hypothetical protein
MVTPFRFRNMASLTYDCCTSLVARSFGRGALECIGTVMHAAGSGRPGALECMRT